MKKLVLGLMVLSVVFGAIACAKAPTLAFKNDYTATLSYSSYFVDDAEFVIKDLVRDAATESKAIKEGNEHSIRGVYGVPEVAFTNTWTFEAKKGMHYTQNISKLVVGDGANGKMTNVPAESKQ